MLDPDPYPDPHYINSDPKPWFFAVLRIRIRIDIGRLDPDPGGQKLPTKIEKSEEISCFEILDVLF
jgi:hypothetical protein